MNGWQDRYRKTFGFSPRRYIFVDFPRDCLAMKKPAFPLNRFVQCIARSLENWYNFETYGLFFIVAPPEIWHRPLFVDNAKQRDRKTNYYHTWMPLYLESFFFFLENIISVIHAYRDSVEISGLQVQEKKCIKYFNYIKY